MTYLRYIILGAVFIFILTLQLISEGTKVGAALTISLLVYLIILCSSSFVVDLSIYFKNKIKRN